MLARADFDRVAALTTSTDNAAHAPLIAALVRWLEPEHCLEVGTDVGGMAIHIARALQENARARSDKRAGHLVCLDDFSLRGKQGWANFWHNIGRAGVGDVVSLVECSSAELEAWPKRVDFAFIDGDHSLEGCRRDVNLAAARGARCIVVHDIAAWWGPAQWLREDVAPGRQFAPDRWGCLTHPGAGGLAVLLRHEPLPPVNFQRDRFPGGAVGRQGSCETPERREADGTHDAGDADHAAAAPDR